VDNPSRRRVLAAGVAGTALGLIGGHAASAGTIPPEEPESDEPVARPTPEDLELLDFALSVELSAGDLYQASIDAGAEDPIFDVLRNNHRSFADVLSGILGTNASRAPDVRLFDDREASFAVGDVPAVAAAGYDLESTLVATHTELLRSIEGTDGAEMLASILIVEARNCAVLADLAGNGDDLDALFVNDAEPLAVSRPTGG
jgi:hypothetical protein